MATPGTSRLATAADAVGVVSVVLGGALTAAPRAGGRRLGLTDTGEARVRGLGAADLGLGITIIASRSRRWRWATVAARSVLHLAFAREYARSRRGRSAALMLALFATDAGIAWGLRPR